MLHISGEENSTNRLCSYCNSDSYQNNKEKQNTMQEESLTKMIIDNIDFNRLIIQYFDRIYDNAWTYLCYLIVLEGRKYFGMNNVSFDFLNALHSSDSSIRHRTNVDRKVLQSLDSFIDDVPWNSISTFIIINFILVF